MSRYFPGAVFLLLSAILLIALWDGDTAAPADPLLGMDAPALRAIALDGGEAMPGIAALGSQGPFLVNFFASWCAPCQAEHAQLLELRERGVRIVGILWHDDPAKGAAWLKAHGDPYRQVGHDRRGETAVAYGLTGVPESVVVDSQGKIAYHLRAPLTPALVERELLPRLLP